MHNHLESGCRALYRQALDSGVAESLARRAYDATTRVLESGGPATYRRAEAYFWAVVRRRSVRDRGSRDIAERLVLEAVIADLRNAGREDDDIAEELERGWRGRVADGALEAVTERLCA